MPGHFELKKKGVAVWGTAWYGGEGAVRVNVPCPRGREGWKSTAGSAPWGAVQQKNAQRSHYGPGEQSSGPHQEVPGPRFRIREVEGLFQPPWCYHVCCDGCATMSSTGGAEQTSTSLRLCPDIQLCINSKITPKGMPAWKEEL